MAVRLWGIEFARFADDQATLLGSAAQFAATHQLPLTTGMSFTIGIRHPPLATFLLIPPALLSRSPVLASAYVALLDALAALFVYAAARRVAGRSVAAAAGLLYALEPSAVVYGRTIWNPDLVPLCAAVALWGLIEFWQRDNDWAQAAALFAIGCAAQLHPQAAALLVVWLAVTLAKGRWRWPSAVAVLGLGVTLGPYLYLQISSGWADLRAAALYLQQPKQLDGQALAAMMALFSEQAHRELLLPHDTFLPAFSMDPLGWFFAIALAAGLALTGLRRRGEELVVAGCFVAPLLAALNHAGGVAPHYLLALLPAGCILAALAIAALPSQALATAILVLVLGGTAAAGIQFKLAVPEQGMSSNYGMPLRYSVEAADLASASSGPLYVSNRDQEAGVFGYLLPGRQKRFDGRYAFVLPPGQATYLADGSVEFAYGQLTERAASPARTVKTPGGLIAYGLFIALDTLSLPSPAAAGEGISGGPLDVDVGHAVRLLGYEAPELRGGSPSPVRLAWRVTDAHGPIPDDVREFGHLVDASGRLWSSNADFRGYPRPYWEDGETVVSAFALNLPPDTPSGGYWFETGFYEPISGQRLPQYRGGQAAGTAARIGPLKVSGRSPAAVAERPLAVLRGGEIALLSVQRGADGIDLRWQALRKPAHDYTAFVHVLNAQGAIVAQQDGQPRGGSYPTSLWDAGEVVDDPHPLSVAAAPGVQVGIGLYTFPDLRRLPVDGTTSDRVLLPLPTS